MAAKKKEGRTKSNHNGPRAITQADRDYHRAIHTAEQTTKRQIAWTKVISTFIVMAGSVALAWLAKVDGPGGAPWWCWVVMSVAATVAVGFGLLYWSEKRRNGFLIERFAPYVKALEKAQDPRRSSSQLTPRGETKAGDE